MNKDERGIQPVRVLPYNIMDWFLNITPDFEGEFNFEIDSNGLNKQIVYRIDRSPIKEVAEISMQKQITIHENFNQYLWALSYSLLVLFDEGIHRPTIEGRFKGQFDDTPHVKEAWELFKEALKFTQEYNDRIFFHYPNPETKSDKIHVGLANGIYSASMTFILLHEFGHQYYGHLDYYPSSSEESRKDELTADDYAIDKISQTFSEQNGRTNKMGVVIGMLSLMFLSRELDGGDSHPDLDVRLKNAIEKLELDELDNLWGIASMGLNLWTGYFNHNIIIPVAGETYKELFYSTYYQLQHLKKV
jgi:hypothetical protein